MAENWILDVKLYDFELLKDGAVIEAARSIALPDLAAA
jgi:hypothetical protein